ncbi:UNVERIFIED_CONTAM: GlsB/YeaQ/YmgE family stress response membrane protein [Streptococcus canis]|uniref:GlsB/YeaQ/YmgE family stress response membrane protein n=2 Tax=Streptococcus canis TaxID=1329 RepID=A0A3P5Y6M6_STRCB|nr:GlsB/YeaQ/YmgE family stress response membrane protein [Streptococcus canis]MDV5972449.1 GlsB/YeaQ/YmgE family stress response membrane protein [Streptococcus canis]MDV5976308.1 GlsB/YeaQ/YmgE family stress response membrane protein [Streptococcus canis]MDW7799175.1 GlsB/YeaQ/YmgE family stress response membrane protein [Streptococcus canis]QJD12909.1 GlsB/YeaQ/YmgE family stress response membrane protein [Streptococcus canis]QKG74346.1 GlsB/YeaQ/YmgE family stress response membrane protein
MIWSLIVGAIIGMIAGKITEKGQSMGCFTNSVAGLIGSAVGQRLFGDWGIQLAGMAIFPSIMGAAIVIVLASALFGRNN